MPIEILPPGITREMLEKAEKNKREAKQAAKGCLFLAFAVTLFIVFVTGYTLAKLS